MSAQSPRLIDAQRSVVSVAGQLSSPQEYASVLEADFSGSYADGRDLWTEEAVMRQAPQILHTFLGRPGSILDVGAGRGRDTRRLLELGHRVTAVDLVAVPDWAQLSAAWGEGVSFHTGDLLTLTLGAKFDGILDNGCLHHQHPEQYQEYLERLRGLSKPGGLLTVSVFHAESGAGGLYANKARRLYRLFEEPELVELLGSSGFSWVDTTLVPRAQDGLGYLVVTARSSVAV